MQLLTLSDVLPAAERGGYAVGSFAPRYTAMIAAVLRGGQKAQSPLIVQISEREMNRYGIAPAEFAHEFFRALAEERTTVPVVLHLDHTKDLSVIEASIAAGFTSVMIDASDRPLDENIGITKAVVAYAHARGVTVEAELGRIGRADSEASDVANDEKTFTDPGEARRFVEETGVDALAVAVGTAHGVYLTRQPKIDYERLQAIRAFTRVPLVLHGGSGVPPEMMRQSYSLPGGGISKVNIATDLELAMLGALGLPRWITNAECKQLPPGELTRASAAVEQAVVDKITYFCSSQGRAADWGAVVPAAKQRGKGPAKLSLVK